MSIFYRRPLSFTIHYETGYSVYYCALQRATPYILNALCGHINQSLAISLARFFSDFIPAIAPYYFCLRWRVLSCGRGDVASLTSRERRSPDFEAHSRSAGMGTRICTHFAHGALAHNVQQCSLDNTCTQRK